MSQVHEPDVSAIADEILGYLRAHPQAADTLDGIAQFWLIRSRYLRGLGQVQAALELLVQSGRVIEQTGADTTRLYRTADAPEADEAMTGRPASDTRP